MTKKSFNFKGARRFTPAELAANRKAIEAKLGIKLKPRIRRPPPPPEKLAPEDQARLDAILEEGLAELDRGEYVTAEEVLARLRARR